MSLLAPTATVIDLARDDEVLDADDLNTCVSQLMTMLTEKGVVRGSRVSPQYPTHAAIVFSSQLSRDSDPVLGLLGHGRRTRSPGDKSDSARLRGFLGKFRGNGSGNYGETRSAFCCL